MKIGSRFNLAGYSLFRELARILMGVGDPLATALYLERSLKPFNKKVTRLGQGLPVGGELEYTDEETLSSAIDNRK